MKYDDNEQTEVRGSRPGRREQGRDPVLRAKLIFLGVAAVVLVILIGSFVYASKARLELSTALKEIDALRHDNSRLAQQLDERIQQVGSRKKQLQTKQTARKPKPQEKKKVTSKKTAPSRKTTKTRSR
ncbi:MAG: hypothetical protein A2X56_01125 [Nitrospirae bacterium GWC2_57_13]|jgi:hypothetical protein|nr:MAG: hypothetical protein A2072_06400 [Nitrospirae bacterium GWC1_57_7]OGW26544.1 MAG: hypothetical protein A2X56_01125 [Nitrospirae bacterium GWC2_57_13]OGW42666.1 MAG: hypothetical protein A2X57_11905 [Nitrospirae bacterium GWD2_57_8]HAR45516.1 hypothetical protein [Nitrospiraceae bacterium]HAS54577.1 hypothetical protein [Nitrospiraceae bacterium]